MPVLYQNGIKEPKVTQQLKTKNTQKKFYLHGACSNCEGGGGRGENNSYK